MKYYAILILLFVVPVVMMAQHDLPSGQIEVIKDFEVRLMETQKIRIVPHAMQHDTIVRSYAYDLSAPSPAVTYLTPELKPLAMSVEKKPAYYPLYAKAGYGSPNSLLGALSYDHVSGDALFWGFDFRHLSANNKKIPVQRFADSQARIDGGYILANGLQVDGYIDARFETHYFYGADPIPPNTESLRRKFNRYDGLVKLSRHITPESAFHYHAFLQYNFDKDDLGSGENTIRLGGGIGSALAQGDLPVGLGVLIDQTKLTYDAEYWINNILLSPFAGYSIGDLKIHLGGKALLTDEAGTELLPDIGLSYGLFNHSITLRAGWDSDVAKNNFHSLSIYNPYIRTRLDSINNRVSRRYYAGISGTSGTLEYAVTAGYTKFKGMAFFLQYEFDPEQFTVRYDDGSYIGLEGSIKYELLKHVIIRAQAWQRFYKLEEQEKTWHVPALGIDGQVTYDGGDDTYHISILFYAQNGLPYRTIGGTELRLDPLIDLNLHGDYYITESIGVFGEVNNILGNKRERWTGYPRFGFNVKGGVVVRM